VTYESTPIPEQLPETTGAVILLSTEREAPLGTRFH